MVTERSNEPDPDGFDIPKAGKLDALHTLVKALLSAVPYAGGPAAEVFAAAIAPPLARRRDQHLTAIVDGLRRLRETVADFNAEKVLENELFITTVVNTTRAAMGTHREEKHKVLRNAVLNVATASAPDEDAVSLFIGLIERFTPWHLVILGYLEGTPATRELRMSRGVTGMYYDPVPVLEQCYSGLKGRGDFCRLLLKDLETSGMITLPPVGHAIMQGPHYDPDASLTTEMGKSFLAFIKSPIAEDVAQ